MKINLSGYYGMSNYGDELFSLVTYTAMAKNKCNKVGVISPENTYHSNVKYILSFFPKKIYSRPGFLGGVVRALINSIVLLFTDHLIFSGGSTIGKPGLLRKFQVKMLSSKQISCIGVSVDEVKDDKYEKWLIKFVNSTTFFSVRDLRSYKYLCSLGLASKVTLAADIAGSLPFYFPEMSVKSNAKSKVLGVSVCSKSKNMENLIASIIKIAKVEKYRVKIFCLNEHLTFGDKELSIYTRDKILKNGVDCSIEYECDNVLEVWSSISKCDFFVSVRLHGAITAYMAGVPFYMDCYHIKCFDFLKSINYEHSSKLVKEESEILQEFTKIIQGDIKPEVKAESYMKSSLLNFKSF